MDCEHMAKATKTSRVDNAIIVPADTQADLALVAAIERQLLRQTGSPHKLVVHVADKGKRWALCGWRMGRKDTAVIAMLRRRGVKPHGPALLKSQHMEAKTLAMIKEERKLTAVSSVAAIDRTER